MERQKGVLSTGNGEMSTSRSAEREVVERGVDDRRAPPSPHGFVDREEATGIIVGSLQVGLTSVEITGEQGIGKSPGCCATPVPRRRPVQRWRGPGAGRHLRRLRPAAVAVRRLLRHRRSMSPGTARTARASSGARGHCCWWTTRRSTTPPVEQLQDVAPACAVLLATHQPTLQREAGPIVLGGLSATDSMAVLARAERRRPSPAPASARRSNNARPCAATRSGCRVPASWTRTRWPRSTGPRVQWSTCWPPSIRIRCRWRC